MLWNKYFTPLFVYFLLLVTAGPFQFSYAGGFQINTQGQKAVGMGGCFTAVNTDASALYFNPGGMTFLEKKINLTAGVAFIIPRVSVQTGAVYNTDMTSPVANPVQFYFVSTFKEKFSIGFGVNNQFGSTSSYPDEWQGKYVIQTLSLKTFMYQPTFAYKFHDNFSIGAGFVYASGKFSLKKAVPLSGSMTEHGEANLSGAGDGFGFNAGIFSRLTGNFSIGASYRSSLQVDLQNGSVQFSDIPSYLNYMFPDTTSFTSSLTLPAVLSAGIKYRVNEKIFWVFDVNRTFWSSYDSLKFDFYNAETPDAAEGRLWRNTITFRTGASYQVTEKITLRAGCYYDQTPVMDGFVSPELPDNSHAGFTAGLGYKISGRFSFDIAWLYSNVKRDGVLEAKGFSGKYHRIINVIGIGANIAL